MSGPPPGAFSNIHKDVLDANPETDEAKESLIAELKSRGNNAFKHKRLMEADVLYSKAIDLDRSLFTFFGNRSAARLGMGCSDTALQDAESAIEANPTWAKGYFRKGQALEALKRYNEAIEAYEEVLKLEPDNKAVPKKLQKVKAAAKEAKDKPVEEKKESSTKVVKRMEWTEEDEKKKKKEDVVQDKVTEKEKIRGYKVTKEGKKTTFFNNDLTEEEKKLIGDIAPKAITGPVVVNDKGVGSAWSNGSTFEEKNMTGWAKDALERRLLALEVTLPTGEWGSGKHTIKVTKVDFEEGDASIPIVRGKVKFVFDFHLKLTWEATVEGETHKGEIMFPDVSSDHDNTFDSEVRFKTAKSTEKKNPASKVMASHVKSEKDGFKPALVQAILEFEQEFRAQGPAGS